MHRKKPTQQFIRFEPGDDDVTVPERDEPFDPNFVDSAALTDEIEELKQRRVTGAERIAQMKAQAERVRRSLQSAEVVRPLPEVGDPAYYAKDSAATQRRQQRAQDAYLSVQQEPSSIPESPYGYYADTSSSQPIAFVEDESAPIFYDGYTPETDDPSALTNDDYIPRRIRPRSNGRDDYESYRAANRKKRTFWRTAGKIALMIAVFVGLGFGGMFAARRFVVSQGMQIKKDNETTMSVRESVSEDGHPAHTITIYGRENATVYLREISNSYVIADGKVEVTIPDYMWYDTESSTFATPVETDTMDVTITPLIRYSQQGDQYQLDPIEYQIDVPLSPIYLLNPSTPVAEVAVSIFEVRINVEQGSNVIIDGTNVSTLIRDETGNVSKNVQVLPVGENKISISVKSKYCRENKMEITLIRAEQDIPLELDATVLVEWNYEKDDPENRPLISGTTLPGATITVEFPHEELEVNQETGQFSFRPIFTELGNNEVVIRASYEGREDAVIVHNVYYMPNADIYTRRAWSLSDGYNDLINYIDMRKGTIYVGTGVVERIISTAPQLAIMNIGGGTVDKKVLIENSSKTTWAVGQTYRIYGEAYGLYDSMPRLTVRYTYLEE